MSSAKKNKYIRALGLGVMSGMRSLSGPLVMAYRARREPGGFQGTWLGWFTYGPVLPLTALAELGELVIDKTGILSSRLDPLPLLGRVQFGGAAGAAAFTEADESPLAGAAIAAAGAVASSFLFYHLRRNFGQVTGLPDTVGALLEDGTMAGIGLALLRTYD